MKRRIARWIYRNVPLPRWLVPHVLGAAYGAGRFVERRPVAPPAPDSGGYYDDPNLPGNDRMSR